MPWVGPSSPSRRRPAGQRASRRGRGRRPSPAAWSPRRDVRPRWGDLSIRPGPAGGTWRRLVGCGRARGVWAGSAPSVARATSLAGLVPARRSAVPGSSKEGSLGGDLLVGELADGGQRPIAADRRSGSSGGGGSGRPDTRRARCSATIVGASTGADRWPSSGSIRQPGRSYSTDPRRVVDSAQRPVGFGLRPATVSRSSPRPGSAPLRTAAGTIGDGVAQADGAVGIDEERAGDGDKVVGGLGSAPRRRSARA